MAKGRTLWEMLVDWVRGPIELRYLNPLRARIGSAATINDIDLAEHNFFIKEIREYQRDVGGGSFAFTDYHLLAKPLDKPEVWVKLRLNPRDVPSAIAGMTHDILLLQLDDEFEYDKGFHDVLCDDTKKFEVREDDVLIAEYWRINETNEPYVADVSIVQDTDQDGRVERDEVQVVKMEFWDYWRETNDEAGQPYNEYLFAEMDQSNGYFQIWKGKSIGAESVTIF